MSVTFLTDEDEKRFVKSVNGITPDENGNVEVQASADEPKDGITPHIGDNGNWWIGKEDTGVSASVTDEQIERVVEAYMEDNPSVKTVNGLGPDENGNVEIDAGGEGLTNTEKSLLLSLFENAAYVNGDMGVVFRQLRNLWQGLPENTLLYWDYTLDKGILECGFVWDNSHATNATYSMADEGLLMVNSNTSNMPFFNSVDAFDLSKVEIEYVVHPVTLITSSTNFWGGICICRAPYFTVLSPYHAVGVNGEAAGSYVLPALNRDYTITISGGRVYVDGTFVVDLNPSAEPMITALGGNGQIYIKSIRVGALED